MKHWLLVGLIVFFTQLAHAQFIIAAGESGSTAEMLGRKLCPTTKLESSCRYLITTGSLANLEALHNKKVAMAFVQSDLAIAQYHNQIDKKNLRLVAPLYWEKFLILTRQESDIVNFEDIRNKTISSGLTHSGPRAILEYLMRIAGIQQQEINLALPLSQIEQAGALCGGEVDAIIYMVSESSTLVKQASQLCPMRAVRISSAVLQQYPQSATAQITRLNPKDYPKLNVPEDLLSVQVLLSLFTTAEAQPDLVYETVSKLMRSGKFLPLLRNPKSETWQSLVNSLDIPLHQGASRYFVGSNDRL